MPALAIPQQAPDPVPSATDQTGEEASKSLQQALGQSSVAHRLEADKEFDISDSRNPLRQLTPDDLPRCPECDGLLRPGVVWFGEPLPSDTINAVDRWIEAAPVDLILVIGTSVSVYPAAGYVDVARDHGARVAVVNMDPNDIPQQNRLGGLQPEDWFFQGDAGIIVPEILKSVIGEI